MQLDRVSDFGQIIILIILKQNHWHFLIRLYFSRKLNSLRLQVFRTNRRKTLSSQWPFNRAQRISKRRLIKLIKLIVIRLRRFKLRNQHPISPLFRYLKVFLLLRPCKLDHILKLLLFLTYSPCKQHI